VYLAKHHPEVRAAFDSRYFLQAAHAPALGSAVAVGFALARPRSFIRWILAASVLRAWTRHRRVYFARRDWPRALPQWLVFDVADVAVMAVASVRNRTLVL
jgi:hypothetical protein